MQELRVVVADVGGGTYPPPFREGVLQCDGRARVEATVSPLCSHEVVCVESMRLVHQILL